MDCKIADVKQGYSIRWLKDGKELANEQFDLKLTNTTQSKSLKYSIDPVNYKLTIVTAMFNDEGIYDCAMFNDKDEFIIKSKQRYSLQIKGKYTYLTLLMVCVINSGAFQEANFNIFYINNSI